MLPVLLAVHSVVRWAVLLAAAWATLSALRGLRDRRAFTRRGRLPGVLLSAAADTQLLVGLVLWAGASPYAVTAPGRSHWWTFAHPLLGLLVVALAHVGSVKVRRALDDRGRWLAAARFHGAALVVALVAVPWPFLRVGRPLLPF